MAGGREARGRGSWPAHLFAGAALTAAAALPAGAQDATWLLNPGSGDFNTAANWSPATVPTGTASFDTSNTTALSISAGTIIGGWTFNAGASNYSFTNTVSLTFNGAGIVINGGSAAITNNSVLNLIFNNTSTAGSATITNNSGMIFNGASTAGSAAITNTGSMNFNNTSTAASATINNNGGLIQFGNSSSAGNATINSLFAASELNFNDTSTAASATINNGGTMNFRNSSSAGSATITNINTINFIDNSTAGNATINSSVGLTFTNLSSAGSATINNSGGGSLTFSGGSTAANAVITNDGFFMSFANTATAGNATITNNSGLTFFSTSTAGSATIINNGTLTFGGASTAGSAIITNNGTLDFGSFPSGGTASSATVTTNSGGLTRLRFNGSGGDARFITNLGGTFDMSTLTGAGSTAGSIEGAGSYVLGAKALTTGSNNLSTEVSGVISGAGGSLIKVGTGTLTLSGDNTYTGGTVLNGGTLSLQHYNALGTGALTILGSTVDYGNSITIANAIDLQSNATLNVDAGTATQAGIIAETGGAFGFTKTGTGTLVLSGNNTYTGGTVLNGGTLSLQHNNALGTGALTILGSTVDYGNGIAIANAIDLQSNGTLNVDAGTATQAGIIAETGGSFGITKTGSGTLILLGANTYTGATGVNAGTLQAGAGNVFAPFSSFNVAAGATLDLDGFDQTLGSLAGAGSVMLGAATLTAGGNIATTTFSGAIAGTGGLTKAGLGTLTLSGINTYTGATTVNAGALIVNGSIAASSGLTVNAGAVLGGTGILPSTVVNAGATLSPGQSIGTITVNGNLALNTGSTYLVEVSPSAADRTNVSGTATLAGTVNAAFQPGSYNATSYTILSAAARVGTFSALTTSGLPAYLSASLSYTPTEALLVTLVSNISAMPGLTPNQGAVAGALDAAFNAGQGTFPGMGSLAFDQFPGALDALSGEVHASVLTTLANDSGVMRSAILSRLVQADYLGDGTAMASLALAGPMVANTGQIDTPIAAYAARAQDAYAANLPFKAPPVRARNPDWTFWAQAFGAWGRTDSDGNAAEARRSLGGFVSGVDRRSGDWRTGLAAGYTASRLRIDARSSSATIDTAHLAGYLAHAFGAFKLRSGAAAAWHETSVNRTAAFPGFIDGLRASYHGNTVQAFGEIGYGMSFNRTAVEPYVGLAWVRVETNGFSELGGAAALTAGGAHHQVGYTTLGVRAATTMVIAGSTVVPHLTLAWQHVLGSVTPAAALAFLGTGAGFTISGVPLARDSALIDAGLDVAIARNVTVGSSYIGQLSGPVQDHAVKGRATVRF